MPKENKFSGLYEPDKDTCTASNEENIARFREATLKLDRIHNNDNEQDLTDNIIQLCIRYNKTGKKVEWELDYEDAMTMLEEVYNDVDADFMIEAVEALATRYGYVPEMDETVDVYAEMYFCSAESMPSLLTRIQTEYVSLVGRVRDGLKNKIAGGMRAYEIERDNTRPTIERGQIWKVESPVGIGNVTNGYRWVIVISNQKHVDSSNTVNVIYLVGNEVKKDMWQMEITNADLEDGALAKLPSRVNITDIFTMDKLCFMEYKGKVNDNFMAKMMKRIQFQLGMIDESECEF